MTHLQHGQSVIANTREMTLTSDHRVVYRPDGKNQRALRRWLPFLYFAVAAVFLISIFIAIKPLFGSPTQTSVLPPLPAETKEITPVTAAKNDVITGPSQEWMSAFKVLTGAASELDEALMNSSMSSLLRIKPAVAKLTAEQRKLVNSHRIKGLAALNVLRFEEASIEFLAAYEIDSTNAEVAEKLGYALYKDGKSLPAINALLRSLLAAPQRTSTWGNLGVAYALAGEQAQGTNAFNISLFLAKPLSRTRNNFVSIYQEDQSPTVRSAVGTALATHFTRKVDTSLREHLGSFAPFLYSAFMPSSLKQTDNSGVTSSVFALNNTVFPITSSETNYSVWLGSNKNCGSISCIIGRMTGAKSSAENDETGLKINLIGGVVGVLQQEKENQLARLTIKQAGMIYTFELSNEAQILPMVNSALGVGPIPVSVFVGKPANLQSAEPRTELENTLPVSTPGATNKLPELLIASSKEPTLTSEQIYAKAAASVVVITVENGQGSGVVVAPEIVITNCHVINKGSITVSFRKAKYAAVLIAGNEAFDFCVLKVAGLRADVATVGPLTEVGPGQRVYSLGSPRGFELTFADGLVSALRTKPGIPLKVIQMTAPISPGSSGGGLFDQYGRLIGITTFYRAESQNLNFAMPAELYRYLAPVDARSSEARAPAVLPPAKSYVDPRPYSNSDAQTLPNSDCDISFAINIESFGEDVSVELRRGEPGSSRYIGTRRIRGGSVRFLNLCPGSYFVAIGNSDTVSVTPTRQFLKSHVYTSRLTIQKGSGNVTQQKRTNL